MDLNEIEKHRRRKERLAREKRAKALEEKLHAEQFGLIGELSQGDGIYYIAQESAFMPGIVEEWPAVIPHPTNPHGRLVKRVFPKDPPEDTPPPKRAA